jgi:hypothetical protein
MFGCFEVFNNCIATDTTAVGSYKAAKFAQPVSELSCYGTQPNREINSSAGRIIAYGSLGVCTGSYGLGSLQNQQEYRQYLAHTYLGRDFVLQR